MSLPYFRDSSNACRTQPGPGKMCVDERPLVAQRGSCIASSAGLRKASSKHSQNTGSTEKILFVLHRPGR